jgi:ParB-like chromosome segregation protein Spo0J
MSDADRAALTESVRTTGLHHPIVVHEDKILDGVHRYQACISTQTKPVFEDFKGPGTPLEFVLARNVARRNLSTSQKAMVAARLARLPEGRHSRTARDRAVSQAEAADLVRVGRTSVQAAKVVLDHGIAALTGLVEADHRLCVTTSAKIARRDRREQDRWVREFLSPTPRPGRNPARSVTARDAERPGAGRREGARIPLAVGARPIAQDASHGRGAAPDGVPLVHRVDPTPRAGGTVAVAALKGLLALPAPGGGRGPDAAAPDAAPIDPADVAPESRRSPAVFRILLACWEIDDSCPTVLEELLAGVDPSTRSELRTALSRATGNLLKISETLPDTEDSDRGLAGSQE